jgi:hypothetical protein
MRGIVPGVASGSCARIQPLLKHAPVISGGTSCLGDGEADEAAVDVLLRDVDEYGGAGIPVGLLPARSGSIDVVDGLPGPSCG